MAVGRSGSGKYGKGVSLPQPPGPSFGQAFVGPQKPGQISAAGTMEPNFGLPFEGPQKPGQISAAGTMEPNFGLPIEMPQQRFPRGFGYLKDEPPAPPQQYGTDVGGSPYQPQQNDPNAYGTDVREYGNYHFIQMPQTQVTTAQQVTFGLNTKVAPPDLPAGVTPSAQNFLVRDGGIEPRFKMASLGTAPGLADVALGLQEYSTTTGLRAPVVVSARTVSWFNSGTGIWSTLSYVKNTIDSKPSGPNTDYWDFTVTYHPTLDENILVLCNGDNQAFSWDGSSAGTTAYFSSLTNAPIAKYVAEFDSRVVFGYVSSGGSTYPQRIIYTGRGFPETANQIASDGGFYDLLDATGRIQRLVEDGQRLLVFFEYELWQGYRADYPFDLQFITLHRGIGLVAPFSTAKTPYGTVFLGSDYRVYLIPPGGTPQSISDEIWASMREEITSPERAVGIYDERLNEYQLFYPVAGGTGRPTHSRHYQFTDKSWTPHTFGHDVCALTNATLSSSATTFGGLVGTFNQQPFTYGQLAGVTGSRTVLAATSSGTVGQFTSTATTDLGTAVDAKYVAHLGNAEPDRRLMLKELWIDYRADSASSLTIGVSKDFGQTITQSYSVALPAANPSAQTVVQVGLSAVYPSVVLEDDHGTRFRIQRMLARTEDTGRG